MQNPYAARNMIKNEESFFGRIAEVEEVFRNLNTDPFQNTSIVGERRCGKSSLLWHISQPRTYLRFTQPADRPFIFLFFDLQKVANLNQNTFFRMLTDDLVKQLPSKPDIDSDAYETYQEYFYELVDYSADKFRVVVCLDEFETILVNDQFDDNFLFSLRSLGNASKVAYITSSKEPLEHVIKNSSGLTSDFWNIFVVPPLYLGLLKKSEARDLVITPSSKVGLQLTSEETDYAFELAGYHALFLQIACFYLFEEKQRKSENAESPELTQLDRSHILDNFLLAATPHLEHMWSRLSSAERNITVNYDALGSAADSENAVAKLLRKGLMIREDGLRPFSPTFEKFARKNFSFDRAASGSQLTDTQSTPPVLLSQAGTGVGSLGAVFKPSLSVANEAKLDIWIGRKQEVLISFSGAYNISQFCINRAKIQPDTIKRFDNRVRRLPQIDNWRAEKDEIGKDVFEMFEQTPELSQIYTGGRSAVKDDEDFLLTFKCPQEMLAFPFEFLNCLSSVDEGQKHLVLCHPMRKSIVGIRSKKTPLARSFYQDSGNRILLVSSNVSGTVTYKGKVYQLPEIPGATKEIQALEQLIDGLKNKDEFQSTVDVKHDVTSEEMADLLQNGHYDVVHFSGHGMFSESPEDSCLFFWRYAGGQQSNNEIDSLTANELNVMVEGTNVKFVYLSCCQGATVGGADELLNNDFLGIAHSLLVGGVPSVLSMRWPLNDDMAVLLASSFYKQIFRGEGLERSLFRARKYAQSRMPNDYNWLSPVLVVQGD
jgi:uncharacterized protein